MGAENWQQTGIYYVLLRDREGQLAGGVADAIQLERNGESLSYLAVQSIQESLEELEERMDAESTWFRFQVKTADGGQVLATNLKEGETLSATVSSVWYSTFVVGEHFTQEEYDLYNSEMIMYSQSACRDRGASRCRVRRSLRARAPWNRWSLSAGSH